MNTNTSRLTWLTAFVVALALVSTLVYRGSYAAFSAITQNGPNSWTTGSIALADDDDGQVMFAVTNLAPGDSGERCIEVTYDGSQPPDAVRLHAAVSETDGGTDGALLADHLNITVSYDADAGSFDSCGGFVSEGTLKDGSLASIGASHTNSPTA